METEVEKRWVELGVASRRAGLPHDACPISEKGGLGYAWRIGWMKEFRRERKADNETG